MNGVESAVRRRVLAEHGALIERAVECAADVAGAWDGNATGDRAAVVEPLERRLESAGVLPELPRVLTAAVDAAGGQLSAAPVAAPPYVVVTSLGPLCRATIGAGRLVVAVRAFAVERGAPGRGARYVHRDVEPAASLSVALR